MKQQCEPLSISWHGRCRSIENCDKHCKEQEQAEHGTCHGFWYPNVTVISNAKKNEHMYNDYSYHVNGPVVH